MSRRHLTDFAGARAPAIRVASADQLTNINPVDIFTKVLLQSDKCTAEVGAVAVFFIAASALPPPPALPRAQIKLLAGLVFGLFGLMHLLAGLAFALDRGAKRALLARMLLLRARQGAAASQGQAEPWAWHFSLVRQRLRWPTTVQSAVSFL